MTRRAHPDNARSSPNLLVLKFITSVKSLLSHMVTITGSRDSGLAMGDVIQPTTR